MNSPWVDLQHHRNRASSSTGKVETARTEIQIPLSLCSIGNYKSDGLRGTLSHVEEKAREEGGMGGDIEKRMVTFKSVYPGISSMSLGV